MGRSSSLSSSAGATFTQAHKTVLVLGSAGNIGPAAVRFLADKGYKVIAGDRAETVDGSVKYLTPQQRNRAEMTSIDATSLESLRETVRKYKPDLCLSTLPPRELSWNAAVAAAAEGVNYVSSNFLSEAARGGLDKTVRDAGLADTFEKLLAQRGVCSEWERGLDPGMDSWAVHEALRPFTGGAIAYITSMGAGVADKPKDVYCYTWTGVTNGMGHRPAVVVVDGRNVTVGATEKFLPKNRFNAPTTMLADGTQLETYPNDDGALRLIEQARAMDINVDSIAFAATLTGRHQGHCALWDPLVRGLGILDNQIVRDDVSSMRGLLETLIRERYAADPQFASKAGLPELQHFADCVVDDRELPQTPFREALGRNGFLSVMQLETGSGPRTAQAITEAHLARIYAPSDHKIDRSIIYVEVHGVSAQGRKTIHSVEIDAFGDRGGMTSMQKTVAGVLAYAAQQILDGRPKPGLHDAMHDVASGENILKKMQEDGSIKIRNSAASLTQNIWPALQA